VVIDTRVDTGWPLASGEAEAGPAPAAQTGQTTQTAPAAQARRPAQSGPGPIPGGRRKPVFSDEPGPTPGHQPDRDHRADEGTAPDR
jgi:hypothetical protein